MEFLERKQNILIVDDFPDNAETVGQVLQSEFDCEVFVAFNGREALQIAEKFPMDLILLDVMMPEMDGYEVCHKLKKMPSTENVPVIFLTAKTDREDYLHGFKAGGLDYISKPFDIHILLARVRAHLLLKNQQDWMLQASQQYKELIRMMCHDLINPIGSLKNIFECAWEDPTLMDDFKDDIMGLVNLSLEMIEQVRTIRKLEEGRKVILKPVSLNELVDESVFLARNRIREKGLNIQVKLQDDLWVLGERVGVLNSILGNLLSNSIKFSEPGSTIQLNACASDEFVQFSIEDSGIGIPIELMPDLFDLTKAKSRPGTKGEMGAGYGMPVMKRYLDLFGASVQVDSCTKREGSDHSGTRVSIQFKKVNAEDIFTEQQTTHLVSSEI